MWRRRPRYLILVGIENVLHRVACTKLNTGGSSLDTLSTIGYRQTVSALAQEDRLLSLIQVEPTFIPIRHIGSEVRAADLFVPTTVRPSHRK